MATVLVVDDDPISRAFLRALLDYRGHRMCEAADGTGRLGGRPGGAPDHSHVRMQQCRERYVPPGGYRPAGTSTRAETGRGRRRTPCAGATGGPAVP